METRLEKFNHLKRQKRFYVLNVAQTLFGEWCLVREWGRIGAAGGQKMVEYWPSQVAAETALAELKKIKGRRGYAVIPVQLVLL